MSALNNTLYLCLVKFSPKGLRLLKTLEIIKNTTPSFDTTAVLKRKHTVATYPFRVSSYGMFSF